MSQKEQPKSPIETTYPKLMEAAPDLVRACEECVAWYMNMSKNPNFPVSDRYWIPGALMAREALRKAKGER